MNQDMQRLRRTEEAVSCSAHRMTSEFSKARRKRKDYSEGGDFSIIIMLRSSWNLEMARLIPTRDA